MPLTAASWNQVVRRKRLKSGAFKALNRAVVAYLRDGSHANHLALVSAWRAWQTKLSRKNKSYRTSNRYTGGCALDDIARLVAPSAPIPTRARATSGARRPRSHSAVIRERDAMTPDVRAGGNNYVLTADGWQQRIFPQEEHFSCTCACATTFLSRLIDKPVTEDAFKAQFRKLNGAHDFSSTGTFWPGIKATLEHFGADVTHHDTPTWDSMKALLNKATAQEPVLLGVFWTGGGGHAVMGIGPEGKIDGWPATDTAYPIEDPWPTNSATGLEPTGTYWTYNTKESAWQEATVGYRHGCITGKRARREFGRRMGHREAGVALPGMT